MSVSRRDFLGAGAAAAAGLALPNLERDAGRHRCATGPSSSRHASAFAGRPVVISSANGFAPSRTTEFRAFRWPTT